MPACEWTLDVTVVYHNTLPKDAFGSFSLPSPAAQRTVFFTIPGYRADNFRQLSTMILKAFFLKITRLDPVVMYA